MAKVTYDANIYIRYKEQSLPRSFYMSAVVLQELVAGANDASAIKEFERLRQEYRTANKLLVPKRAGVMVVTDNVNDFIKIRNFCDVKVISGSKYFSMVS